MFSRRSRIVFILVLVLSMLTPGVSGLAHQYSDTVDVRIWTFNMSDEPVYDICYTLVGYSNTGCDENQDGNVLFEDIPVGKYQVELSYPNGSVYETGPFTITVSQTKTDFSTQVNSRHSDSADVLIWTATEYDLAVFDICYELSGYSKVGCDENRDGNVSFADIPYGTYTVVASYPNGSDYRVESFQITVDANNNEFLAQATRNPISKPTGFVLEMIDVSLITLDPETGNSLTGACYELLDYSHIGCDENHDGKVEFADIPYGQYTVHQTQTPEGYDAVQDYTINVVPGPEGYTGGISLIVAQAPEQADEDHVNVSVVITSLHTGEPLVSQENCLSLATADGTLLSNQGCDDGVVDGQIDFLNVEASDTMRVDLQSISLECPLSPSAMSEGHPTISYGDSNLVIFFNVETDDAFDCDQG